MLSLLYVTVVYKVPEPVQTGKNYLSSESSSEKSSVRNSSCFLLTEFGWDRFYRTAHFLWPLRRGPSCRTQQSELGFRTWTRLNSESKLGPWGRGGGAGRAMEPKPLPGLCTIERLQTTWALGQAAEVQWESLARNSQEAAQMTHCPTSSKVKPSSVCGRGWGWGGRSCSLGAFLSQNKSTGDSNTHSLGTHWAHSPIVLPGMSLHFQF